MTGSINKAVVASGVAVLLAIAAPAAAQTLDVGIMNVPPMGGAEPSGYCFDLMTAIGTRIGAAFEFTPLAFAELVPALAGGETDVLCSLISPSNNWRATGIAFTGAIANNADALVVRADDATAYAALDELRGEAVGTIAGAALFVATLKAAGIDDVRVYPTGQALYEAIAAGEVKAGLVSSIVFSYVQKVAGAWPTLRMVDTYVSPTAAPHHAAIAVRSDDTALLGKIQAALEAMKADGTLAAIREAWAVPPPIF